MGQNFRFTYADAAVPRLEGVIADGNPQAAVSAMQFAGMLGTPRALEMIVKGDYDTVSKGLGQAHKVRNFYNNIIAPMAEFGDVTISEKKLWDELDGVMPKGKILMKDRIADSIFQQIQTRPDEYSVLALPNLNGDYLSDAAIALVGGLGLGPGANMSDEVGLFEATHGTAPKYTGMDKVNPGSLILSAVMMLNHMGWNEAADLIIAGLEESIKAGHVTYDLARLMNREGREGVNELSCSGFGDAIIERM